jgi:hypothetical protein
LERTKGGRFGSTKWSLTCFGFHGSISGLHKRVGEVKKRDKAMTIDVFHAIQAILHAEWGKTSDPKIKRRIAEMGTWIIGGFCVV